MILEDSATHRIKYHGVHYASIVITRFGTVKTTKKLFGYIVLVKPALNSPYTKTDIRR